MDMDKHGGFEPNCFFFIFCWGTLQCPGPAEELNIPNWVCEKRSQKGRPSGYHNVHNISELKMMSLFSVTGMMVSNGSHSQNQMVASFSCFQVSEVLQFIQINPEYSCFSKKDRGPKGYQATIDGVREPHVSQDVFAPRIVGISGLGSCN